MSKIQRPFDFLSDVYRYELVGPKLGLWIAILVPWLELVAGVCLLGGVLVAGAFLAVLLLAGAFTWANVYAIHRGLAINCGCFGGESDKVGYGTLVRALVLLFSAGAGYLLSIRDLSVSKRASADGRCEAREVRPAVTLGEGAVTHGAD